MPLQSSTSFNMEHGRKKNCFFHNRVYVNDCGANSHLRRCPSPSKMPLQSSTSFNMEHGGKNVFSITGSMLMIAGPIFTFKNLRKISTYLKLFHVNVGLANFCSMLNLCGHFLVLRTFTLPCSMLACESIFLHVLTLTWNKRARKRCLNMEPHFLSM